MKQGSNANFEQEDLVAWLSSSVDRCTLHLSRADPTKKPDSRIQRAVARLIDCDAGIRLALEHSRSGSLSWTFDPRPGHEHDHDPAIEMILPLLLPRRVIDNLYPFQRSGVAWLMTHDRAILADDMGLGKTIQVIGALRRLLRWGRVKNALVVAPRTLLQTWHSELDAWAPELLVERFNADSTFFGRCAKGPAVQAHLVLASYEQLRSPSKELRSCPPDVIVADEAHRLRKSESLAHQGLRRVRSDRIWALTGTPVERYAEDLSSLLSLLAPSHFAVDDHRLGIEVLRARALPYILRRTKSTVLPELPSVSERHEKVELLSAQRATYMAAIRSDASLTNDNFLALFNHLLGLCDLDEGSGESSKLDRAMEIVHSVRSRGEKVVVFSHKLRPLKEFGSRLRAAYGEVAVMLTGEMDLTQRRSAVRRFKTQPDCDVLLASMKVSSEGLTLTEANNVVFLNRWWNPSTNSQAIDRVVRIGQHRPVTVYYLTCIDTVEDRLEPLLMRKELTFAELIDVLQQRGETMRDLLAS